MPKVIPSKIRAQYEEQEKIAAMHESLQRGEITFKRPEGIDRRYASVRDLKEPEFSRNIDKSEAGVKPEPESSVRFAEEAKAQLSAAAYEKQVNGKVSEAAGSYPKFTFESKELYERAHHLCQQIPHWKGE